DAADEKAAAARSVSRASTLDGSDPEFQDVTFGAGDTEPAGQAALTKDTPNTPFILRTTPAGLAPADATAAPLTPSPPAAATTPRSRRVMSGLDESTEHPNVKGDDDGSFDTTWDSDEDTDWEDDGFGGNKAKYMPRKGLPDDAVPSGRIVRANTFT